jgi:hypothetical protein
MSKIQIGLCLLMGRITAVLNSNSHGWDSPHLYFLAQCEHVSNLTKGLSSQGFLLFCVYVFISVYTSIYGRFHYDIFMQIWLYLYNHYLHSSPPAGHLLFPNSSTFRSFFFILHMTENMWYLSFWVWLISFNMMIYPFSWK